LNHSIKDPAFWVGHLVVSPYPEALRDLCLIATGLRKDQVKSLLGAFLAFRGFWETEEAFSEVTPPHILTRGLRAVFADWNPTDEGIQERELIEEVLRWGEVFQTEGIDEGFIQLRRTLQKTVERGRLLEAH